MDNDKNLKENLDMECAMEAVQQFPKICRICLEQGAGYHIFEITFDEKPLLDVLNTYTTLQIKKGDSLPQNLCTNCLSETFQMCTFLKKCQEADTILHYIIQHSLKIVKTEDITVDATFEDTKDLPDATNDDLPVKSIKIIKKTKRSRIRKTVQRQAIGPPFNCKKCGESFKDKVLLKNHRIASGHSDVRTYLCAKCPKILTKGAFFHHMKTHAEEKAYKCKVCSRRFSMSGNLKQHMMIHTGERPHVCEFCDKAFRRSTCLHNHKKTCTLNQHGNKPKSKRPPPRLLCNFCGSVFQLRARYNAHIKRHDSKIGETIKDEDDTKPREYVCAVCSRAYKTKHLLKSHVRIHGEKAFVCGDCSKSFISNAALLSHRRMHTGEKPYPCSVCGKAFSQSTTLRVHMSVHTGEKPYQCSVCSKSFSQLSHIKYHRRTHIGEK